MISMIRIETSISNKTNFIQIHFKLGAQNRVQTTPVSLIKPVIGKDKYYITQTLYLGNKLAIHFMVCKHRTNYCDFY